MQPLISVTDMNIKLRGGSSDDAKTCGEICYRAFKTIADHHNFPADLSLEEATQASIDELFDRPDVYAVVAEVDGEIVGSNFLSEGMTIAGVGTLTVSPSIQNATIGRHLMQAVLERLAVCYSNRARQKRFAMSSDTDTQEWQTKYSNNRAETSHASD